MANFLDPIWISLKISLVASVIVTVLGISVSRMMAGRTFRGKSIVDTIIMLPLVLPPSVVGFILLVMFGASSPIGQWIEATFHHPLVFTWQAGVIAASVVAFPLMYQSAKVGFESVDRDIEDAARVDGAGRWMVLQKVSIPLASNALLSGIILSFARALGEFGATLMFAGNLPGKTQTMPTAIYVAIDSGQMTLAWSWVVVTILISTIMLLLSYRIAVRT
ncbi:molybdate ABC transporter permease subunit [Pseudalkalibacillus hwajinpoensis]|uniref:Molybdenum transport system permease n=1 Tax=Guptibacillus hwajinpoensis TaxID=208199 RepID=A0A4U1MEL5_9BACL|nr:molybdate ABC transporter permease subunit [Pseudalkalibacillus hwajinpoensis]TKD69263.1 molybdate ABC transporter permease subunit [Pseudalkalibacillus hwajinpoensis]